MWRLLGRSAVVASALVSGRGGLLSAAQNNVGKTHFIADQVPVRSFSLERPVTPSPLPSPAPEIEFCSPRTTPIRDTLLELIASEQEEIKAAVYLFTDEKLAQALVDARKKKIPVSVVTDPSCLKARSNKAGFLAENDVAVHIYDPQKGRGTGTGLMHLKMAYFKRNTRGGKTSRPLAVVGSHNWTNSAAVENCECMILTGDPVASECEREFEELLPATYGYTEQNPKEEKKIVAKNKRARNRPKMDRRQT